MKGMLQSYQTRQNMLKNEYEIFHYKDLYLKEVELHHHDFYEVYLFLAGKVTYVIEGQSYFLRPGDIVLISPDELHQPLFDDSKPNEYERIVLWIKPQFLRKLGSDATDLSQCFDKSRPYHTNLLRTAATNNNEIQRNLYKLLAETGDDHFGSDVFFRACIQQIMIEINRCMLDFSVFDEDDIITDDLIHSVTEYINRNLSCKLTLEEMSSQFYISKYHLLREFKHNVGTTVHRYILQKRLILAKQLILQDMPITEVFVESGFGDYSNFFRAFKMEYGITPKEFLNYMKK